MKYSIFHTPTVRSLWMWDSLVKMADSCSHRKLFSLCVRGRTKALTQISVLLTKITALAQSHFAVFALPLGPWSWVTRGSGWNVPLRNGTPLSRTRYMICGLRWFYESGGTTFFAICHYIRCWKTILKYAKMQECHAGISHKDVTLTSANLSFGW